MADERTRWTERIEKAGQMAFKLSEMSHICADMSINEAKNMVQALLDLAREQDKEIIRLQGMLGVEATGAAVDEHLALYGSAYLYHGRLLDPTKVGIKRLKLSSTNLLKDLGASDLEIIVTNDGPIVLRVSAKWYEEALFSSQAFTRVEIREARDPYNLVLERLRDNTRGKGRKEHPCLKEADSQTSSTGGSPSTPAKAPSTTASPEGTAGLDTSPSARTTSERSPKDKPASDPQ